MTEITNKYVFEWAGYRIRINEEAYNKMLPGEKTLGPTGRFCIIEIRDKQGVWHPVPGVQRFSFEINSMNLSSIDIKVTPYGITNV